MTLNKISENTPSFFVNDDKATYHCFGCGAHGDVFSFIMESEGLNYKDSLIRLADIAGVEPIKNIRIDTEKEKNKTILEIHQKAMQYYKQQLMSKTGSHALRYIQSRGLSEKIIEQYDLGYSPKDSTGFIKYLKSLFQESALIDSGVVKHKNSKLYDPFYNRLVFPIKNKNSKVIAFGGRVIDHNQKPKYLNSAESKIFNKSSHLYGFDKARKLIYKKKSVLVVEGYMDVLSLANHNIFNAVAPLGTAIKVGQIQLLWDLCSEPIICFDNDEAGKNATRKIAYDVLPQARDNQSLKIVLLKDGNDPDKIIAKNGLTSFCKQIDTNINLADFIFMTEIGQVDLSSPEKKVLLRNNLEKLCLKIHDKSIQKSYQRYFREKYFKLLENKKGSKQILNYKADFKKYFEKKEKNIDLYMLVSFLVKIPKILDNNRIFEEFVKIDLPCTLDKVRKIIFDSIDAGSKINIEVVKSLFINTSADNYTDFFDNISDDIEHAIFCVERILKSEKVSALRGEIANLQRNMLKENSAELMQKILYLKKNEQEIEKDLVNLI